MSAVLSRKGHRERILLVGGTPFSFTAPHNGFVIVKGGTVLAITFTRCQVTLTGQTSGIFPLYQGDTLTVSYSGLPTMVFVPM